MNNILIVLLVISLILSLVIYYYINANIIEKFYQLTESDFKSSYDFLLLNNKNISNKRNYNKYSIYNNDTLEPEKQRIIDEINICNNFEEKINGYGFL